MTKPNTSLELLQMIDPSGGLSSCWPYIGKRFHRDGYGYPKRNQKPTLAHRWSYEHHYNVALKPSVVIRHTCDNRACCNPLHLMPGTQADNIKDMDKRNRRKTGRHPLTLNQDVVCRIYELRAQGLSQDKIALTVGCSQPTVGKYLKCSSL